jgi:hypothetical protein
MTALSAPLVLIAGLALGADSPAVKIDYLRDIKPILAARCYACHGAVKQKGSLRLDTAALVREGGGTGPAVVPGKPADSLLLKRVLGLDNLARMPPPDAGEALKSAQVALIRQWIAEGATGPVDEKPEVDPREHWAFKSPIRPTVPRPGNGRWVKNPIDAFLAAEHRRHGLVPQGPAEKRVLLRRVYLDLIGLPPIPEEIEAFVGDASSNAYEKAVDRLLASPQYGERWARHWMDVWRYSDWWGLGDELRNSQKHMWHWRDWIVESLNRDKGYDCMLLEMLAADELYPSDADALRGTGFLARHYFKFNRTTWLDETIEHTAKAFLGLTMNCAKCHDHKYDPISQGDYYRFRAFFEPYQIRLDQVPGQIDFDKDGLPRVFDCNLDTPTFLHIRGDEHRPDKDRLIAPGLPKLLAPAGLTITPIELPAEARQPGLRPFVRENYVRDAEIRFAAARAELVKMKTPVAEKSVVAAELQLAAINARAAADRAAAEAADSLQARELAKQAELAEKRHDVAQAEAALARALAQQLPPAKANPQAVKQAQAALDTARKALENPGSAYTPLAGALKTLESNLETQASRRKPFPKSSTGRRTALARWIAATDNPLTARVAVNHMWARHFGRPLVPTVFDFGRKGTPPTHPQLLDWLAVEFMEHGWSMKHLHRMIVTSAAYRMSSSLAGTPPANRQVDPDNHYLWRVNAARMESQVVRDSLLYLAGDLDTTLGGPSVPQGQQELSRRRSLYFFHSAIERNRFLATFDEADPLECYRRRESIVPQQALALSNSQLALKNAGKIAIRLVKHSGDVPETLFARAAFTALLATTPTDDELAACTDAMSRWRALYVLQAPQEAAQRVRAHLVHALVNHNDFVTVR